MTTNNQNNNVDAEIRKKLDAIRAKSKNDAKLMASKVKVQRNITKTP